MADNWQMSNGWYRPTAGAARSQPDLTPREHQSDRPHAHLHPHIQQASAYRDLHAQSQASGSSSPNNIRPIDNINTPLYRILEAINRLGVQQLNFNESLAKSDKRVEEVLSSVLSLRETADGLTKKLDAYDGIKEALERSSRSEDKREREIDVMKVLVGEMKAFKKTLGKSCDGDDGRTVLGRLDAVTFAVGELLERARDPEANLPRPSTPIVPPSIIDLTGSISPLVGPTSPVLGRTYAEVATSPVSSPLPLKEKSLASIRASPQCDSDSSGSISPYPGRSSSAHTFAKTGQRQGNPQLEFEICPHTCGCDITQSAISRSSRKPNWMKRAPLALKDGHLLTHHINTREDHPHCSAFCSRFESRPRELTHEEWTAWAPHLGHITSFHQHIPPQYRDLIPTNPQEENYNGVLPQHPLQTTTSTTTTTTTTPDMASSSPTQLEFVYPIPIDEDTVDSIEPAIDSQTTATIITNNSEAVSQTQKNSSLSNAPVTTTKTPHVEINATDLNSSMPNDLAPRKDAQTITTLDDKNDKPADIHDARLLNVTRPETGIQNFKPPASAASASSPSPVIMPRTFTQTEVQRPFDKNIVALTASAQVNPYLGNVNSSVSEGIQQQKEQSQKQGLPERLESPLSTSTRDGGTSLDSINLEKLNKGADGKGNSEAEIKAMKGAEEIKITENRVQPSSIELENDLTTTAAQRIVDVPAPTPGRIDLSQLIRSHRSSSSRVASPSTSLSSSIRSRARSRLSVSSPEGVTYSSSFPSDTKLSSTKTKILAGAGVSCSSAAPPPTTPVSTTPSAASVTTRTPVNAPIKEAASISSQSAFRPTTNAELVPATILPATPATIFTSTTISPTKRITPAASESPHLESAPAITNNPLPPSPTSILPAATSTHPVLVISPTTPTASSRLLPLTSPAAIYSELPPPSQASNISQDEVLVTSMVIEKENETNEGEAGDLVEKTPGKVKLQMASRKFENEEEEEEKQQDRRPSLSLSPLSSLSPSISGSPYRLSVKASGLSTPRPRSAILFPPLPHSPLASVISKNQTQTDQVPEAPSQPLTRCIAVVSSNSSPTSINLVNDQPKFQSPLFSSPTNSMSVEQRKEEEEESVSSRLKSPYDNNDGTTNSAIPTTASKVAASVSTHIPAQAPASIEILLPRDLSPISEVEKGGKTVEGTDKTQVEKVYTSLGDNADIVRVKKRKVLEECSRTDREPLGRNPFDTPLANGKREGSSMVDRESSTRKPFGLKFVKKKGKETDDSEVGTKSGEAVKKRSLFSLKVDKKGDSLAVTRVRKRKTRPDSIVNGETDGVGQHKDGLDEERPLKRARQRVSDSQMKTEPADKGKQLSGRSETIFAETLTTDMKPRSSVSVKRVPPLKARSSVNKGQAKAEVKWPTIAEEYKDLVECDKCRAWYHYGCVGLSAGDKRIRGKEKFFCPPCEAGTTIKKINLYADCWRPGCTIWTGYIVERIIGRSKKSVVGKKNQFKYLLQWKGYKLSESSWEPEESMFDPSYMIEKFRADALKEGIDIDKQETGVVLLQVAKDPSVPQPT